MAAVAELEVRIKGNTGDLTSTFSKAEKQAKSFGDTMSNVGRKMQSAGRIATVGLTAPIVALGAASIKAASNLAESVSKVEQVFKNAAPSVLKFAKSAADSIGQSEQQALEAAGTFGNLFTAFGMGEKAAASMSTELVALASDLASFNNMSIDEVLIALRSGLTGEVEPLKRLGAAFNQAELEAKALKMGLVGVGEEMTEADKIAARYALVLDKTKNSQGDFARTADGMANSVRTMQAHFEDAKATLGEKFLPVATDLVKTLDGLMGKFERMTPLQQDIALNFVKIAAAIGPAMFLFGKMSSAVGALAKLGGFSRVAAGVGGIGTAAGTAAPAIASLSGALGILQAALVGAAIGTAIQQGIIQPLIDAKVKTEEINLAWQGTKQVFTELAETGRIPKQALDDINLSLSNMRPELEANAKAWNNVFGAEGVDAIRAAAEAGASMSVVIRALAGGMSEAAVQAGIANGALVEQTSLLGSIEVKGIGVAQAFRDAAGKTSAFISTAKGIAEIDLASPAAAIAAIQAATGKSYAEAKKLYDQLLKLDGMKVNTLVTTTYKVIGNPKMTAAPTLSAPDGSSSFGGSGVPGVGDQGGAVPKAIGGPVSARKTYLVGEKGPEIFVPNSSGEIIPNHRIGSTGGRPMGGDGASAGSIIINLNVEGSVVTERDLLATLRQGLIQGARRGDIPLEFTG